MTLPILPSIPDIQARLQNIFPAGLEMRGYLVREMAAKVIYVALYGGMIEGNDRRFRPSHIYFYTENQAAKTGNDDREYWVKHSIKPGFRPEGVRWYADTTKEPIRDETLRALVDLNAVGKLSGIATTSSKPTFWLKADFAQLFDPACAGPILDAAVAAWQAKHLSPAARARMAILAAGMVKKSDEIMVACPDGTIAKLSPGPSSNISKDVVEVFSQQFLKAPALLWLSESGNKIRHRDEATAKAVGIKIDKAKVLPDIILVNIGESGTDTSLVFVEVVATDGPMNQGRKDLLLEYVRASGFPEDQCVFGTAFEDRADSAFKKCLPQLAWGTFAWFRSEPERLIWLADKPFDITK
jgi:hypothetical protein